MANTYDPYTLGPIDFVAGTTIDVYCEVVDSDGLPYILDASNDVISFSVVRHNDRGDTASLAIPTKTGSSGGISVVKNAKNVYDTIKCTLTSAETKELNGKYIYQITIYDASAGIFDIRQGVMYVHRNIDKSILL